MKKIMMTLGMAIGLLGTFAARAQDTQTDNHTITIVVPNVALLDLETGGTRNFTSTFVQPTPLEAGQKVNAPSNNSDIWLNYSSILPTLVTSRRVDVKSSALVAGVDVTVLAGSASTGAGTKGTPASVVTLSTSDQPLINSIGTAYTATGASNGHNLTYAFATADGSYASLRAASSTITVTYTLADN